MGESRLRARVFAILLLAVPAAAPRAADFSESGFETPAVPAGNFDYNPNDPTPGQSAWTYLGASGIANIPGAFGPLTAPEGNQVAFLQTFGVGGTSEVCQTLSGLTPGVEYFVSALLALHATWVEARAVLVALALGIAVLFAHRIARR